MQPGGVGSNMHNPLSPKQDVPTHQDMEMPPEYQDGEVGDDVPGVQVQQEDLEVQPADGDGEGTEDVPSCQAQHRDGNDGEDVC